MLAPLKEIQELHLKVLQICTPRSKHFFFRVLIGQSQSREGSKEQKKKDVLSPLGRVTRELAGQDKFDMGQQLRAGIGGAMDHAQVFIS